MNSSEMPFWFQGFESGGGSVERRKCVWILLSLEYLDVEIKGLYCVDRFF